MSTRMTGGALRLRPADTATQTRNQNVTHLVKIMAVLTARPDRAGDLRALLDGMVSASRAEPGNLRYDLWQDQADPTRFVLDELYAGPEAVAAHRATPHFQNYLSAINALAERNAFTLDPAVVA
jgi:quinol monooxygenase YgiN